MPTPLLMTEKDAVKCRAFARSGWYQLVVEAQPDADIIQQLTTLMTDLRS